MSEALAELNYLRHENSLLRDLARQVEPDRERMEAYERDLKEIGRTLGCDHIDDGLERCVSELCERYDHLLGACERLLDATHPDHFAARLSDSEMEAIDAIKAAVAAANQSEERACTK